MAIRISRNVTGDCLLFEGSSNPIHWNPRLSAEVDSMDPTAINVINERISDCMSVEEKAYEFRRTPFSCFVDSDGESFASASDCAAFINDMGNDSVPELGTMKGKWDARDAFCSEAPMGGDWLYVNHQGNYDPNGGPDLTPPAGREHYFLMGDVITWNGSKWVHIPNEDLRHGDLEDSSISTPSQREYALELADETGSVLVWPVDIAW